MPNSTRRSSGSGQFSTALDLHVVSPEKLRAEILEGDDFVQWSIRFGLLLFDDGTVLDAARLLLEEQPWPDFEREAEHAAKSLDLARRVVETGDADGGLIQVRTALSLAARAYLLSIGRFPSVARSFRINSRRQATRTPQPLSARVSTTSRRSKLWLRVCRTHMPCWSGLVRRSCPARR
jgi:hypothetical protein